MSRLFLSLFAIVLAVIVAFSLTVNGVTDFLFRDVLREMRDIHMGGIISQLDDEIAGLDERQRKERIEYLRSLFRYELDLIPFSRSGLTEAQQRRLRQGGFVAVRDGMGEIDYHRSRLPGYAWKLEVSLSAEASDRQFLVGPLELIVRRLLALPRTQWKEEIAKVDRRFGIPIGLLPIGSPALTQELNAEQRRKLAAGDSALVYQADRLTAIYYRIGESDRVLKVGTIEYPLVIVYIWYLVIGVLAALVGAAIWLWLRPVWQDLRRLRRASESIAGGRLATRIEISRYSFIKGILQAFNAMAGQIEQLITSHKTLTNAVSHELRTPVARLRFSLEMLERSDRKADGARYLQAMNTDIDELDEMLTDLLSYARLDRQSIRLEKTPVVPGEWLEQQVQSWKRDHPALEITVRQTGLPEEPMACMDPKLMIRALHNLLQNACRYAETRIQVAFRHQAGCYRLSVEDDGCGIPEPYRDNIFDPFTRVDSSRERGSGGYGLGLAIVKQVANAHGGKVCVDDSDLGGARFLLEWSTT